MEQKDVLSNLNGALESLRAQVRGRVILPGDERYEASRRVWNGMIDKHPAVIVQCKGAADVMAAVNMAREQGLSVAIRGGGHNVAGNALCDDGLVIDLSMMNAVRVDPVTSTVRVEGGAHLGDVDHETQAFGLAVPLGVVTATGVAGLSLHGGLGFLTRKYGLTSDNLIAADVVTAEGRLLTVDENHHPELLWALRGGGGGFGVVTSFEFKVHPVGPEIFMGITMYPASRSQKVLTFFGETLSKAPDELMSLAVFWNAPHEEPIPEEHRGKPVVILLAAYCGPVDKGEQIVEPFRKVDTPVADLSGRMPFLEVQKIFDPEYPDGRRYYWKSVYLKDLGDPVIAVLSDYAARRPSPLSSLDIWALGGAMGRVQPDDTAFAHRDAPYLLGIEANWINPEEDDANISWVRELFGEMNSRYPGGAYLNFPGFAEEGEDLFRQSYGNNFERLRQIKTQYDPNNLFRHNLSVSTDGSGGNR